MTTKELIDKIADSYQGCLKIIEMKNHDYAGDADALANFRYSTLVGVSLPRGILVRMTDKIARVSNLLDKDPKVTGESIADTLDDLTNYTQILKAYLGEKNDLSTMPREL